MRSRVMKLLATVILVAPLATACVSDERWEGKLTACSTDSWNGTQVLLILDTPRPASPTGWFGKADEDASGTWSITEIEDGSGPLTSITFSAEFNAGNIREVWDVELTGGPTALEGEADINTTLPIFGTVNVKCDVEMERKG